MRYKTRQGEKVTLSDEEFASYPFNSKLTLIEEEKKKTNKKTDSKGE